MHVIDVRSGVSIGELSKFLTSHLCEVFLAAVLSNGLEVRVDHRVGVSLTALNPKTTVEEPCVCQHLPDDRVSPIVRSHLWVNRYAVVVMSCL